MTNQKSGRRIVGKHYWWRLSDLMAFLFMLAKSAWQVGPSNVRVEFHPGDKGAELKVATMVNGERDVCGEYNDAHECPIDCD